MPRKVLKKKPIKQKQSQRQSQNVVVNVVLAKHQAKRKPSGKLAVPVIYQPPIRMIQSYGDIMPREPPKQQILGEDIRKIIKEEIKSPVAELREDFLSRIENKPKDRLIPPPLPIAEPAPYDFSTGFEEPVDMDELTRGFEDITLTPSGGRRDPFLIDYDGATLEMLLSGNYGLTRPRSDGTGGGNRRTSPTKRQKDAIDKYKNM